MTDKEIEGVSPDEWAKALNDARRITEGWGAWTSYQLLARALLAAQAEIERVNDRCRTGLTIGGGHIVYGSFEAISRAQTFLLVDSTHPIEKADTNRLLLRDLQNAESELSRIRTLAEGMAGALETANHILWARLNDTDPVVDRAHRQVAAALAAYRKQDDGTAIEKQEKQK